MHNLFELIRILSGSIRFNLSPTDGVGECLHSLMLQATRSQRSFIFLTLWMLYFVVILALINRSIKTTITKVFKSVVQMIYTWIMLRTNTDSC